MATHQLAQINDESRFESLICDIFNLLGETNSYKKFGRKGHKQKGIDVFSSEKDIVIQCKKKDLSRKEILIRKELMNDIESDLNKILSTDLKLKFNTIYFTSTYKDHPDIDEFCEMIKEEKNIKFDIIYWGWDTIEEKIIDRQEILAKYYNNFIVENKSKEESFLKNLNLKKSIEKDFGDWLNFLPEKRPRRSRMIIRAIDETTYPHSNEPNDYGKQSWFRAEIKDLYPRGMEFTIGIESIRVYNNYTYDFGEEDTEEEFRNVKVARIGKINFSDIVEYDINGDGYYYCPHIFCKFRHKGTPFESIYLSSLEHGRTEHFEVNE